MTTPVEPGTPLPWRVENSPHVALDNCSYRELIAGSAEFPLVLGEIYYSDVGDEEAELNARYIDWACNNAPALLSALEEIRHWAETSYSTDFFEEPDLEAVDRVLTENGLRGHMDRMHASWGRHLMQGVGKIAARALAKVRP